MVYLKELRHHYFHNNKLFHFHNHDNHHNGHMANGSLQTFPIKSESNFTKAYLMAYVGDCCDKSSIHCLHYLTDKKSQKLDKLIWLAIIVATSIAAIFVYIQLSELYATQRIQTTVKDSVYPVFFIPFPSIGICAKNRINWPKLQEAHKKFLPTTANANTINIFRRFFERLDDFRFGTFGTQLENIFQNESIVNELHLLDNINILQVMEYLTFTCAEMFEETCYWRKQPYNCCELFTLERTEVGFCHVFNSNISESVQRKSVLNKYYPYHNAKSGERSGLEANVILDKAKMRPGFKEVNGIYIMIKQPQQWHNDVRFINYNTYTKISISAQQTETDKLTREVSPVVRQCFFEDEMGHPMYKKIPGLLYWRGNCITRCHQEYLLKYCNCTVSLLFPKVPTDKFNECKAKDFKCLYEHEMFFSADRHEFESEYIDDVGEERMICNCLNSCNQLIFNSYYTSSPIEQGNVSDTINHVYIDVYYQSNFILKYSTRMRFTFVELLANFGGIIGLFLGASLLSAVELGYFVTIGLYSYLRKSRKTVNFIEMKSANTAKAFTRPWPDLRGHHHKY